MGSSASTWAVAEFWFWAVHNSYSTSLERHAVDVYSLGERARGGLDYEVIRFGYTFAELNTEHDR